MARLERQRSGYVVERIAVVIQHIVDRGTLVPGLGELGSDLDHLIEDLERLAQVAAVHRRDALAHQQIDRPVTVLVPDRPDPTLDRRRLRRAGNLQEAGKKTIEALIGLVPEDRRGKAGERDSKKDCPERMHGSKYDAMIAIAKRIWARSEPRE